jgi:hypothetical protein
MSMSMYIYIEMPDLVGYRSQGLSNLYPPRESSRKGTAHGWDKHFYAEGHPAWRKQHWSLCGPSQAWGNRGAWLVLPGLVSHTGKHCNASWKTWKNFMRCWWHTRLGSVWESLIQIRAIWWLDLAPLQIQGEIPLCGKYCHLPADVVQKSVGKHHLCFQH